MLSYFTYISKLKCITNDYWPFNWSIRTGRLLKKAQKQTALWIGGARHIPRIKTNCNDNFNNFVGWADVPVLYFMYACVPSIECMRCVILNVQIGINQNGLNILMRLHFRLIVILYFSLSLRLSLSCSVSVSLSSLHALFAQFLLLLWSASSSLLLLFLCSCNFSIISPFCIAFFSLNANMFLSLKRNSCRWWTNANASKMQVFDS